MSFLVLPALTHLLFSMPQSEEARAELSQIAWVPLQVGITYRVAGSRLTINSLR